MAKAPEVEAIDAAIKALEDGATKKAACELIGIRYNTARLDKLIEERKLDIERTARLRKKVRGRAPTQQDIASWAFEYFKGSSLAEIAQRSYRSVAVVKRSLEFHGVLMKDSSATPLQPSELPEHCFVDELKPGERVWVPGYQCTGEVIKEVPTKTGTKAYQVYLLDGERTGMYVHYNIFELGSLKHLEEIGVDVKGLGTYMKREDTIPMLNDALRQARLRARDK